jgi:alkylated DNA repair dioxygenase AlkB
MDLEIINETDGSASIFMYIPKWKVSDFYTRVLNNFTDTDWKSGHYEHHECNRIQRFYSIDNKPFCEYWKNTPPRWQPHTYEDWLLELQMETQEYINDTCEGLINAYPNFKPVDFTSALVNKYRNGLDFIPEHRDVVVMDRDPTIASISFGETRTFRVNRIKYTCETSDPRTIVHDKEFRHFSKEWKLNSGDLMIMAGSSQKYFSHEILKDPTVKGPRYNITFR